ncbi:collagen-binding domain-containing protein [Thalassotalea euphylliae]|uniref:collagen-binding domain-containing protein n=1 Tax=Thalassotalea euphylliae TaxID=1655234 RepID=UPI0036394BA6
MINKSNSMMKKLSIILITALIAVTHSVNATSFALNDYNLVTIGDVNSSSLHVHGNAFVGGNLNAGNAEFGNDINNTTALELAGELQQNVRIHGGNSAEVNGSAVQEIDMNGVATGRYLVNGNAISNASSVTQNAQLSAQQAAIKASLESASAQFAAMADVNTQDISGNKLHVNSLDSNGYAVFQLGEKVNSGDAADIGKNSFLLSNSNQDLEIVYNLSASTLNELGGIIINVPGTEIDFSENNNKVSGNGFLSSLQGRANVLWNFFEATSITLNANFYGNILAPLAQLTSSSDIDGSVAVYGLSAQHSGQIHLPTSTIPTPPSTVSIPEPSVVALMLLSLLLLVRRHNAH